MEVVVDEVEGDSIEAVEEDVGEDIAVATVVGIEADAAAGGVAAIIPTTSSTSICSVQNSKIKKVRRGGFLSFQFPTTML